MWSRRVLALAITLALGWVAGCQGVKPPPEPRPVSEAASELFVQARAHWRRGGARALEEARSRAQAALALQPDWIAPRRFLDELSRADLVAVDALAAHRSRLAADPADAGTSYLAGRLEGRTGSWRFRRATDLDPKLAWGWHGMSWAAANDGQVAEALRLGEQALRLARDPFEVVTFQSSLARVEFARGRPRAALERLLPLVEAPGIASIDALELEVQAAQIELSMFFQPEGRRGEQRALRLLREGELTDAEVEALVARLRFLRLSDGSNSLELQLALASRSSPARDRLRAELMLEERPTPLALGLLARSRAAPGGRLASGPLLRAARFAAGQFELGIEEWIDDMPGAVLDDEQLPRDAKLAAVVRGARALGGAAPRPAAGDADSSGSAGALAAFGDSLLDAGWFREARAVAGALAAHDLDRALALEDRAAAGQLLLASIRRLLVTSDAGGFGPVAGADEPSRFRPLERGPPDQRHRQHLDVILDQLGAMFARARVSFGEAWQPDVWQGEFRASPRQRYGWFAELVHPGPRFSDADQAQDLGRADEPVPGLAAAFASIGRFALLGEVLGGGGPDATVLQRAWVERRSGEHLGVPWWGTIAWCEGADVPPRAAREGASISGAALHEGYWVDIDAVRRDRDRWARLDREFLSAGWDDARVQAALSTRGLAVTAPAGRADLAQIERRSVQALLGEAERMRLAVLADRGKAGLACGERVLLDELVLVTAIHEQGHLCDRGRLLPIADHPLAVMGFVARAGFTPQRIAERLEYRAQLVALCEAPDPRLAWVDVLAAGESDAPQVTPHAAGYRRLLTDLIVALDRDFERRPQHYPELRADRVLVHQLHLLPPEKLRDIARRVARSEGLTR